MQTIDRLRRNSKHAAKNPFSLSGLVILAIGGIALMNSLLLVVVLVAVSRISHQKTPTLVQRVDGRADFVSPLENKERTPMVIRRFAIESLIALMNISVKPQAVGDQKDLGVAVRLKDGELKIPTTVWNAGFTLTGEGDFRKQLIQGIAKSIPSDTFEGRYEQVLIPRYVSEPEPVKDRPGEWRVNVVADLQKMSAQNSAGQIDSYNKTVTVRAIDTPEPTSQLNSAIAKQIYIIRQAGLEITDIRDYQQ